MGDPPPKGIGSSRCGGYGGGGGSVILDTRRAKLPVKMSGGRRRIGVSGARRRFPAHAGIYVAISEGEVDANHCVVFMPGHHQAIVKLPPAAKGLVDIVIGALPPDFIKGDFLGPTGPRRCHLERISAALALHFVGWP